MTDPTPDGPTDPQLSALPQADATTLVTPVSPSPGGAAMVPPPPGQRPADAAALSPTMTALPPEPPGRVYGTGERWYGGDSDSRDETAAGPAAPRPGGDRGTTTIAEEVIERMIDKIVDLTVAEVGGVRGLHSAEGQPVTVTLDGEQAEISISVRVAFGYAVHDVVEQLRSGVIGEVERLLGLTVTEVNVLVADVTFDSEE